MEENDELWKQMGYKTPMPSPDEILSLMERKCPKCNKPIPYDEKEKSFICTPCKYQIKYESYCYFKHWLQMAPRSYYERYEKGYFKPKQ